MKSAEMVRLSTFVNFWPTPSHLISVYFSVSSKTQEDLNLKLRSKFNHGITNLGCLHCNKVKRTHKAIDRWFLFQNVQIEISEIFKMFKNNMKFTRVACRIDSKISIRDNRTILMIILMLLLMLVIIML